MGIGCFAFGLSLAATLVVAAHAASTAKQSIAVSFVLFAGGKNDDCGADFNGPGAHKIAATLHEAPRPTRAASSPFFNLAPTQAS